MRRHTTLDDFDVDKAHLDAIAKWKRGSTSIPEGCVYVHKDDGARRIGQLFNDPFVGYVLIIRKLSAREFFATHFYKVKENA